MQADRQTETERDGRRRSRERKVLGRGMPNDDDVDGCLEENDDEGHKLNYDVDMITDYIIM